MGAGHIKFRILKGNIKPVGLDMPRLFPKKQAFFARFFSPSWATTGRAGPVAFAIVWAILHFIRNPIAPGGADCRRLVSLGKRTFRLCTLFPNRLSRACLLLLFFRLQNVLTMEPAHKLPAHMKWETLVAEVASAMNDPNAFHYLDRESLEVVVITDEMDMGTPMLDDSFAFEGEAFGDEEWIDPEEEIVHPLLHDDCPDRIIPIHRDKTANLLKVVRKFIGGIRDEKARLDLLASLDTPKPLHAFRRELAFHGGLRGQWADYKAHHYQKVAEKWLRDQGIIIEKV